MSVYKSIVYLMCITKFSTTWCPNYVNYSLWMYHINDYKGYSEHYALISTNSIPSCWVLAMEFVWQLSKKIYYGLHRTFQVYFKSRKNIH